MTDKQIEQARKNLPPYMEQEKWTEQDHKTDCELSCREMINSILVYWGIGSVINKASYCYERYLKDYESELSTEIVDRLVTEQVEDFKNAETHWISGSENIDGGPYKSVRWADD